MFLSPGSYRGSHCGYCDGHDTSYTFGFHLLDKLTVDQYQRLIDRGYRRSGSYVYKPDLKHSCCPQYTIRLEVDKFVVSREHKKIINRFNRFVEGEVKHKGKGKDNQIFNLIESIHSPESQDFQVKLDSNSFTNEKFKLYRLYQSTIHNDEASEVTESQFTRFLCSDPFINEDIKYGAFHQLYYYKGELIAIGVIDILPKCISSVYLIWHPDYANMVLGKLAVLREISLCMEYKVPYYYLGFYIHNCQKMRYKGLYSPSYLLDPDFEGEDLEWIEIERYKKEMEERKYVTFRGEGEDDGDVEEKGDVYDRDNGAAEFDSDSDSDTDSYSESDFVRVVNADMPGTLNKKQLQSHLRKSRLDLKEIPIILDIHSRKIRVTYYELMEGYQPLVMRLLEDLASALGVELMKEVSLVLR